eukprot:1691187-Amphidinium_carterae.1
MIIYMYPHIGQNAYLIIKLSGWGHTLRPLVRSFRGLHRALTCAIQALKAETSQTLRQYTRTAMCVYFCWPVLVKYILPLRGAPQSFPRALSGAHGCSVNASPVDTSQGTRHVAQGVTAVWSLQRAEETPINSEGSKLCAASGDDFAAILLHVHQSPFLSRMQLGYTYGQDHVLVVDTGSTP